MKAIARRSHSSRKVAASMLWRTALLCCLGTTSAWADDAPVVTARVKVPMLTPEIVRLVARHGPALNVDFPAGTDVLAEVTKRCGKPNASGHYLLLLASANPHLEDLSASNYVLTAPTTLSLPACAYVQEKIGTVTVSASGPNWSCGSNPVEGMIGNARCAQSDRLDLHKLQNIKFGKIYAKNVALDEGYVGRSSMGRFGSEQLKDLDVRRSVDRVMERGSRQDYETMMSRPAAELAIGRDESLGLRRATNTQSVLLANGQLTAIANAQPTDLLMAPADVPLQLSFPVPAGTNTTEIVQELAQLDPQATAEFTSVRPMTAVVAADGNECSATVEQIDPQRWPIAIDKLDEILALTRSASLADRFGLDSPGRVLVADSGLPALGVEGEFLERRLVPDRSANDLQARRVWSLSRANNGAPDRVSFAEGSGKSGHGLGVLSLAAGALGGGPKTVFDRQGIEDRTAFPANIYFVEGAELKSNDISLSASVDEAKWQSLGIDVVNYSLTYASSGAPNIFNLWTNHPEILFVFAAGNETEGGTDVFDSQTYPARLGGLAVPNVISVAASEPGGTLAPFSNYGASLVDIAAPGCRVPTYDWDSQTKKIRPAHLSGTSFAAPLVSLTASLLRQNRMASASAIKRRILASADFHPALTGRIASARVLNVPKAMSTRFDFIESNDGQLRFGRVTSLGESELLCNTLSRRDRLYGVVFEAGVPGKVQLVNPGPGLHGVTFRSCTLLPGELRSIAFQRAVLSQDGRVVFEPSTTFQRAELRHVGLCEPARCVEVSSM